LLFDASIKSIKFKTKLNGNSEKVPRGNVEKNPYGLWNRSWIGVSENSPDHQINGMDYLFIRGQQVNWLSMSYLMEILEFN